MSLTYKQIISDIEKKQYAPVYFLTGEEPYYIDSISEYIEKYVLSEEDREINQTIVYGADSNIRDILLLARSYPMMSERQVIIVKEAQSLKDLSGLDDYIATPQPSTLLVFCYKHKKLDLRTKLGKTISQKTVFFERKKMYDNQLPDWITDFVRERGYQISSRAAMLIAESLGNNLTKIANEFSKLFINIPQGSLIDEAAIEKHIGISKDFNIFELQKAIGEKNVFKANQIINYFADNPKEHPIQMNLPVLYNYFVKIMIYHQFPDKQNNNATAAHLGVNAFFLNDYAVAAKNYSLQKLAQVIGFLKDVDLKSKNLGNNTISDGDLMKELIFKILH